jgi:hypothetical protein
MSDSFAGIDFSHYQSWQQLKSPSGETYYVVPGTGYVYDPFLSAAKGRPVLLQNNYAQSQQAQQDATDQKTSAQKLQQAQINASNPINQIFPIGATVGGLWAAKHLADGGLFGGGSSASAGTGVAGGPGSLGAAAATGNPAAAAGLASDAAIATPAASGIGPVASGDAYASSLGNAAAAETPGVFGSLFAGPMGALGGAGALAAGGITAYESLKGVGDAFHGKKLSLGEQAALGLPTFGLSFLANRFLGHESTRDVAQNHTADLLGQGQGNQPWQDYVTANRQQFNSGPPDPSMPFGDTQGNHFANFDDYKAHGLDAANLTGVYGNLQTFGPDWAALSEDQRQKVTQGLIDAGLYDSHKGEVVITDPDKAKQIYSGIINPQVSTQPTGQKLTNSTQFNTSHPQTIGSDGKLKPL